MRAAMRNQTITGTPSPAPTEAAPEPPPSPAAPAAPADDTVTGADALREAVTEQSVTIGTIIDRLDALGFSIADTRFSVWSVLVVVLVLVGMIVFARIGTRIAHIVFERMTRLTATQQLLSEKLLSIVVWAFAIFIAIDILGVDLTALAVFSGAFGLALGFGLQKTFGNLIAGIILLMDRSIKPGDVIAVSDQAGNSTFGQIRKIGIRAVSVTTRDQREYLIPNENLMINQVENWSYSSRQVRMQVPVRVSFRCDIREVEKLMLEAARASPRVLDAPAPTVWLSELGESSLNFVIHCWILDPEQGIGNVRSDVLKKLWSLFKEHNIEVALPQHDLHLRDNEEFRQLLGALSRPMEHPRQGEPPDKRP